MGREMTDLLLRLIMANDAMREKYEALMARPDEI